MTVSALITNYKAWPLTKYTAAEMLRWSGQGLDAIVIVDDASDIPANPNLNCKIKVHRNQKNLGYAPSINVGVNLIRSDIILFFDCDAYPLMDLLPNVITHFIENPKLGALGFFESNPHGHVRIAGEHEPTLLPFVLGQAMGDLLARCNLLKNRRFVLHSCCMAVRRSAFEQIAGFDEGFDFLDADTDFSIRLQDAGWTVSVDHRLRVFHQGSGSPQKRSTRVMRFHKNRWRLLMKHSRIPFPALARAALGARHVLEWIAFKAKRVLRLGNREDLADKIAARKSLLLEIRNIYSVQP